MKIYKYWQKATKEVLFNPAEMGYYISSDYIPKSKNIRVTIDKGEKKFYQTITCFGGSNISKGKAIEKAKENLQRIENLRNGKVNSEYEVDIKEEIIYKINDENIITRNRYGALVLNSTELMFIDIDRPKISFFRYFGSVFGFFNTDNPKEIMLQDIKRELEKKQYADFILRLYETCNGFRLLISGGDFDPKSKESNQLMKDFNADKLYSLLCEKQECYRARLTPKPFRIGLKNLDYKFPKVDEKEINRLKDWVKIYDEKSLNFKTCKLIFSKNYSFKHPVIELHDKICNVSTNLDLA